MVECTDLGIERIKADPNDRKFVYGDENKSLNSSNCDCMYENENEKKNLPRMRKGDCQTKDRWKRMRTRTSM